MGKIFGAYTDIPWSSEKGYKEGDGNTFVFSLRDDFNFVKLKCLDKEYEIYHDKVNLACIGNMQSGFWIENNFTNRSGRSYLGLFGKFELPQGIQSESDEAFSFLAGSANFKILEIEVYKFE